MYPYAKQTLQRRVAKTSPLYQVLSRVYLQYLYYKPLSYCIAVYYDGLLKKHKTVSHFMDINILKILFCKYIATNTIPWLIDDYVSTHVFHIIEILGVVVCSVTGEKASDFLPPMQWVLKTLHLYCTNQSINLPLGHRKTLDIFHNMRFYNNLQKSNDRTGRIMWVVSLGCDLYIKLLITKQWNTTTKIFWKSF